MTPTALLVVKNSAEIWHHLKFMEKMLRTSNK